MRQRRLLHGAVGGGHENEPALGVFLHRQHGGDEFTLIQRQQVDQRATARGARGLGNFIGLEPVHLALAGEQHQRGVAVGNQQVGHIVLILDPGGRLAATATALGVVIGQRLTLGVAAVGDGHYPVFFGNQVADAQIHARGDNLGAALIAIAVADLHQFLDNHLHQPLFAVENTQQLTHLDQNLLVLGQQFLMLQTGQAVQAQIQNGLGLFGGQVVSTLAQTVLFRQLVRATGLGTGTLDHLHHRTRLPGRGQQALTGFCRRRGSLDHLDHRIDIRQRHRLPFKDVSPLTGLAQFVYGTPGHHFATVTDKGVEQFLQVQNTRLTVQQADHVDAEHVLHLGLGIQVVEDDLGHLAPAQLDHHAHAILVGLIAQLADTFEFLFLDQLGDALDQLGLVDLIGQLVDQDLLAATNLVDILDGATGPYVDAATTGAVGLDDARAAVDDARRREVRPGNMLHQLIEGDIRIGNHRQTTIDHFGQVVRRNIGRHAHGDTAGAVDQQVGYAGRQYVGNLQGAVVVINPVDGFLVQIGQQLMGEPGHADFGVTHGSGAVAIHRTEVALTIDQQVTQGERLGHPHYGVVYR